MLGEARAWFEPSKRYLGERLGRLGLPPLFFTLSGLALAVAAYQTYPHSPFKAALIGTAASLTDFVDGAVARYQKSQSAWGNYLDGVTDRMVELVLLLAMASDLGPVVAWAIGASMLISYCKPRVAVVIHTDEHDWPGVGDHADRMVVILVSMALSSYSKTLAQAGIALLTAGAAFGAVQRILYAKKLIERAAAPSNTSDRKSPPG